MSKETIYETTNCIIESHNLTSKANINELREEILDGLFSGKKYIPSKFFYDERGSKLFEQITGLKEYYPTRTEFSILKKVMPQLMKNAENMQVIELGSGSHSKISILLKAIPQENRGTITYTPVDISEKVVLDASLELKEQFPNITIKGIVTDFMSHSLNLGHGVEKLFCFLGSTIGNLTHKQAIKLLQKIADTMDRRDTLLLGLDMVKDENIITRAYNDNQCITAEFNKNILNAINPVINTNIDTEQFEHLAFFNKEKSRIEMHLVAKKERIVPTPFSTTPIHIKKGEKIHTENSHKFTIKDIHEFAKHCGFRIKEVFTDEKEYFSIVQFYK